MATGIYQIRNLINGKRYIGSAAGKGFRNRWNHHIKTLRDGCHDNIYLQRAWNKYGEGVFIFETLEECSPENCIEREQWYLDSILFASCNDNRFKALGYNILRVAGNVLGFRHSQETKKRIGESKRGNKYCLGRKITQETRDKMSKAQMGKHQGQKNHFYGKQHSDSVKKKMSFKRRKTTPEQDITICQRIATGEKQKDLALEFGVDPSVISCIKRGVKRHGS